MSSDILHETEALPKVDEVELSSSIVPRTNMVDVRPNPAVWLLPYITLSIMAYLTFACSVDDPFITFRYAANITAGFGAVFNRGEHVEGFTSPLHLLLSVLLMKALPAVGMLFKAKIASLICALIMVWQTGCLARRVGLRAADGVLVQMLLAVNVSFAISSVNALETTLYGCLLAATMLQFHKEWCDRRGVISTVLQFLAVLARPEAMLIVLALFAVRTFATWNGRLSLRNWVVWTGAIAMLLVIGFSMRYWYFGRLLPNTYYAKHGELLPCLRSGLFYLWRPLDVSWIDRHGMVYGAERFALGAYAAIFWALTTVGAVRLRGNSAARVMMLVVAVTVICVLLAGGDWMWGWRFCAPVLPILCLFQHCAFRRFTHTIDRHVHSRRALMAQVCVIAACLFIGVAHAHRFLSASASTHSIRDEAYVNRANPLWIRAADIIRRELPSGCLVAYSEMGYGPYLNMDKRFLDLCGLTSREVADLPIRSRSSLGVVCPDWLVTDGYLRTLVFNSRPTAIITYAARTRSPSRSIGPYVLHKVIKGDSDWVMYVRTQGE